MTMVLAFAFVAIGVVIGTFATWLSLALLLTLSSVAWTMRLYKVDMGLQVSDLHELVCILSMFMLFPAVAVAFFFRPVTLLLMGRTLHLGVDTFIR